MWGEIEKEGWQNGNHPSASPLSCYESVCKLVAKQFLRTPVKAKITTACALAPTFQEVGIEPHAVQEVAEFCVGRIHNLTLAIEECICMHLNICVGIDILKEPF